MQDLCVGDCPAHGSRLLAVKPPACAARSVAGGLWTFVRMIGVFGEDVAAWQDKRGYYHMLLQGGPYAGTTSAYLKEFCQPLTSGAKMA